MCLAICRESRRVRDTSGMEARTCDTCGTFLGPRMDAMHPWARVPVIENTAVDGIAAVLKSRTKCPAVVPIARTGA